MQIYFYTYKFFSNKHFYYSRNKKKNLIYFSLWAVFKLMKLSLKYMYFFFSKNQKIEFLNIFFVYFTKYNKLHYSDIGISYKYKKSIDEKRAFSKNISRLKLIEKIIPNIFEKNKSILDVGCGKGENIKYLIDKFNFSLITGIDINTKAIEIIKKNTSFNKLKLINQDICDLNFLSKLDDNKYDYVLISHVLSTIFNESLEKTISIRKEIINHLFKITKIKLIIIDHPYMFNKNFSFEIEQNTRGLFWNDLLKEVKKISTNYYLVKKENSNYLILNK